ncbi:hypothetical protein ASD54_10975 [Rhizobium sp. Root149]|nr:hypothetical protein ASD54_10975 [Rhizobium sp. Root149]
MRKLNSVQIAVQAHFRQANLILLRSIVPGVVTTSNHKGANSDFVVILVKDIRDRLNTVRKWLKCADPAQAVKQSSCLQKKEISIARTGAQVLKPKKLTGQETGKRMT